MDSSVQLSPQLTLTGLRAHHKYKDFSEWLFDIKFLVRVYLNIIPCFRWLVFLDLRWNKLEIYYNIVLDTFQEHLVTGSPWLFYSYNGNKVEVTVSFSNDYYNLNAIFYRSLTWAIRIVFVLFCFVCCIYKQKEKKEQSLILLWNYIFTFFF